jgi:S1-C subfamily serine protease
MRRVCPAVIVALALVVGACGSSERPKPSAGGKAVSRPNPAEAVVYVQARYKTHHTEGTGFIYDAERGLIITSDHAVEAAPAITATDHDGQVMHGTVLARAQCHDFAVVRLHPIPTHLQALTFADSEKIAAGANVTTVSYGLASAESGKPALVTTRGSVSAAGVSARLHHLLPNIQPLIAHQAPLNANGSGSPLLNADGRVVGVNTLVGFKHGEGAVEGLNYALASNFVYDHLRELREGDASKLTGWKAEHACHRAMDKIAGVPYSHTDAMHEDDAMHKDDSGHHASSEMK